MIEAKNKTFYFHFERSVELRVDDIWPDGDAPDNPTVLDVVNVVNDCGGARDVFRDWDLDSEIEHVISDGSGDLFPTEP
jgi:hypothetical protein